MDEPSKKDGFVELLGGGGGNTPKEFDVFCAFISRVPAASFDSGSLNEDGSWRAQIRIDIDHMLAWQVVQEFGFVLNWVSVTEPLPTRFFPRSSPPYLNGGPREYLHWIIEGISPDFDPDLATEWLEGRLPRPVDDLAQWALEDE